jgi:hypothetical protein
MEIAVFQSVERTLSEVYQPDNQNRQAQRQLYERVLKYFNKWQEHVGKQGDGKQEGKIESLLQTRQPLFGMVVSFMSFLCVFSFITVAANFIFNTFDRISI